MYEQDVSLSRYRSTNLDSDFDTDTEEVITVAQKRFEKLAKGSGKRKIAAAKEKINIIQPNFDPEESLEDANFYSDRPLTGKRVTFEDIELKCMDDN